MDDENFIRRIETLVRDAGGQSALARRTGLSLGAIQRYMKGGDPTRKVLVRMAESCGVTIDWLVLGKDNDAESSSRHGADIPVFGLAECGLQGWYNENRLRISTALDWPDPEMFAVIASGHSMAPEGIHPGYFCMVSPNTRAQKGDAVLIRKLDRTATIKVFQREDGEWLYVSGWLDPEKPGGPQTPYTDQIKRSAIEQVAPVIMVKRRA